MKKSCALFLMLCSIASMALTSCCRNRDQIWDDTKSCGRHVTRGVSALAGKHGDSRQVRCREEFRAQSDPMYCFGDEFIPLGDVEFGDEIAMAETSPGDPGSAIPGIEAFRDPDTIPQLANLFRNINFPFDSSLIKGEGNLTSLRGIAEYMRGNPDVYIFVEGHCDERGAEAYNLALGARRSNAVRSALVKEGANPDNIFTISYGTERPLVYGHDENAWEQNRRAEFKVYHHR